VSEQFNVLNSLENRNRTQSTFNKKRSISNMSAEKPSNVNKYFNANVVSKSYSVYNKEEGSKYKSNIKFDKPY